MSGCIQYALRKSKGIHELCMLGGKKGVKSYPHAFKTYPLKLDIFQPLHNAKRHILNSNFHAKR